MNLKLCLDVQSWGCHSETQYQIKLKDLYPRPVLTDTILISVPAPGRPASWGVRLVLASITANLMAYTVTVHGSVTGSPGVTQVSINLGGQETSSTTFPYSLRQTVRSKILQGAGQKSKPRALL